ncbi:Helicase-related protein [Rhodobacter sp. AKP1]|nr:Helicase-related protein [Rhodobacter sp. AKP1]
MSDPFPDCPICQSPGPLAAPRHVGGWSDLTAAEQFQLLAKMGEALAAGARGFHVAIEHGHFILREAQAGPSRLATGADDPLLPLIAEGIDRADSVDLAVAFAMESGVKLVEPWFRDLLGRGGRPPPSG